MKNDEYIILYSYFCHPKKRTTLSKLLKNIIRFIIWGVLVLYIVSSIALNIPYVQKKMASAISNSLEQMLKTEVSIGHISFDIFKRIIIEDLYLHDRQGEIPFKLVGLVSAINREVKAEVVTTETTAKENEHFVIESCELPAEAMNGALKVRVKKTDELDTRNLYVVLRLCGNNHFVEAPINEDTYKIVLTNQLTEPTGWPFGEYSRVKHQFVIKVTGVATDYNKWNLSDRIYYTGMLVDALYEYNKQHPGNPLKDENGLLVTF